MTSLTLAPVTLDRRIGSDLAQPARGIVADEGPRIVVDRADDPWLRDVAANLRSSGMTVDVGETSVPAALRIVRVDLLPNALLHTPIRSWAGQPLVLAVLDPANADLVVDLLRDVDDVVLTTVGVHELSARVRALLRRAPVVRGRRGETLEAAGVRLTVTERLVEVAGRSEVLGEAEAAVLAVLLEVAGSVVSRNALVDVLPHARLHRNLDPVIRSLRAVLEQLEPVRRVEAVRGVGFRFVGIGGQ